MKCVCVCVCVCVRSVRSVKWGVGDEKLLALALTLVMDTYFLEKKKKKGGGLSK